MGRKGWAGTPPSDDAEARKLIIDATVALVERRGAEQTTLSAVADNLGITRRTIYRYFASIEELLAAVAEHTLGSFVAQIEAHTADFEAHDQLIEVVATIIERLPNEPQLALLLANDRTNQFSRSMLTPAQIRRCRTVLQHTRIDWDSLGYSDGDIDELVEFLLRIIQSMVIAPVDPPRAGPQLRAYLRRWVGPALARPPFQDYHRDE